MSLSEFDALFREDRSIVKDGMVSVEGDYGVFVTQGTPSLFFSMRFRPTNDILSPFSRVVQQGAVRLAFDQRRKGRPAPHGVLHRPG